MISSCFINKSMKCNFIGWIILSLLLEFLFLVKNDSIKEKLIFGVLYLVILISFCIVNIGDLKKDLGSLNDQLKREGKIAVLGNSKKIIVDITFLCLLFYYLYVLNCNLIFNLLVGILLFYLIITRIISNLLGISPYLIFLIFVLPLLLSFFIGLKTSFLDWTFISLVFLTVIPGLINEDLKYLIPKKELLGERLIKRKILRIKFVIFSFVPILYLTLLISEKIINSDEFMYFINLVGYTHISRGEANIISLFTLYSTYLKLVLLIFSFIIWFKYKGNFREYIFKKIFQKNKSKKVGRDEKCVNKINKINKIIKNNFEIIKNNFEIILIVLIYSFIITGSLVLKNVMKTNYRGEYYRLYLNDGQKNIDLNDNLNFNNQNIIVGDKQFVYDNVSLTIKDYYNKRVGEFNITNKIIIIKDNDIKYYLLKDSDLFKEIIEQLK